MLSLNLLTPLLMTLVGVSAGADISRVDLTSTTIVSRGDRASKVERNAAVVLSEEVAKRTGLVWKIENSLPRAGTVIVLATKTADEGTRPIPAAIATAARSLKAEGFVINVDRTLSERPTVWIVGADGRGVLFGVGKLLRMLDATKGKASLGVGSTIVSAPAYPIRGHQLGYRQHANTYDAWDAAKFDQYIRELALFGSNSVEGIPFQDDRKSPVMPIPRKEMNVRISEICDRYDQDYWVWTPATFELNDKEKRAAAIAEHEELYKSCPRLDAIFFPGGDPGDNPPELVLPFLEDLSKLLTKYHPKAKIWPSLQGFKGDKAEYVYRYLDDKKPKWIGGLVCGPGSPPIPETRARLAREYLIRGYPDITHNVRCQYPVPWWDPAYAFTLGREAINPRPIQYASIHNAFAPLTAGFISYSDGAHDDVNKVLWSSLAWNPEVPVRQILVEYARCFFNSKVAERAADGILALEENWLGPLRANVGVEKTLALWQALDAESPELTGRWRWQMCQVRAAYDAYTRERLINETKLEAEAMAGLKVASKEGAEKAMVEALAILGRATSQPVRAELRKRIEELCAALYQSIGLQTSVAKYHGSDPQRGCFLDFVDRPLNNRWWIEDEFAAISKLSSNQEKLDRLELLRTWEHPEPGSYYDQVGDRSKAPHVVVGDLKLVGEGLPSKTRLPEILWWEKGYSRQKLAWMVVLSWPEAMRYDKLDPSARYVIRTTGYGSCLLSIDGQRVEPSLDGRKIGEFKEFLVPQRLYQDGAITLTFERPKENVNWREQSRLCEVWLLKRP